MQSVLYSKDLVKYICKFLIEIDALSLLSCNTYLRNKVYTRLELIRIVYISNIWRSNGNAKRLRQLLDCTFETFECSKNCTLYHEYIYRSPVGRQNVARCDYCWVGLYDCRTYTRHMSRCPIYNAIKTYLTKPRYDSWMCRICGTWENYPRFFNMGTPLRHWTLPCRKCGKETKVIAGKAGDGCFKCGICCVKCSEFRKSSGTFKMSNSRRILMITGIEK